MRRTRVISIRSKWTGIVVAVCSVLSGLTATPGVGAADPPQILDESVSGITETSATLEATIDPGEGAAYYQFQLGPEREELPGELLCPSSLGGDSSCEGTQAPGVFPIEMIEGEPQVVELDLADWKESIESAALEPGTGYRFRVVAARAVPRENGIIEWEDPTVIGMNKWFTTLGVAAPVAGPPLEKPYLMVSAPIPPCRKASGRCGCRGFPSRRVDGKVRCVQPKGLPHFRLLSHPVGLSHLPRSLQFGLSRWLAPSSPEGKARPLNLRGGTAHIGDVGVYGVGNREVICMRAWGGDFGRLDTRGANSACVSMSQAVRRGIAIVSRCAGTDGTVQIAGLVPGGVTKLGVDRFASGDIEEVIPVKFNAFALELERVGVVLHGVNRTGRGFKMKLPLRRLVPSLRCFK